MVFPDKKQIIRKPEPMGHESDPLGLCNKEKRPIYKWTRVVGHMVAKEDNMDQWEKNSWQCTKKDEPPAQVPTLGGCKEKTQQNLQRMHKRGRWVGIDPRGKDIGQSKVEEIYNNSTRDSKVMGWCLVAGVCMFLLFSFLTLCFSRVCARARHRVWSPPFKDMVRGSSRVCAWCGY